MNIKPLRKQKKVTQQQLGEALDLTQSSISKMEEHAESMTVRQFKIMCEILDLDVDEIMELLEAA